MPPSVIAYVAGLLAVVVALIWAASRIPRDPGPEVTNPPPLTPREWAVRLFQAAVFVVVIVLFAILTGTANPP